MTRSFLGFKGGECIERICLGKIMSVVATRRLSEDCSRIVRAVVEEKVVEERLLKEDCWRRTTVNCKSDPDCHKDCCKRGGLREKELD